MKKLKNIIAIVLSLCIVFCVTGCSEETDPYDNFKPIGVYVVENMGSRQFESHIEDKELTQKMWQVVDKLNIDETKRGSMGSAYIYMCFYDENESTLGIFTIYENGSCCVGEEFENFYTVVDGENVFMEFYNLYTSYAPEK